jgi:hypothetical protein
MLSPHPAKTTLTLKKKSIIVVKNFHSTQAWRHTPVSPAVGRWEQEVEESKADLDYTGRLCLTKRNL